MVVANDEYREVLGQAGELLRWGQQTDIAEELLKELKSVLRVALGDGTEHNILSNLDRLGLAAA
jgi:hypothetical protein